MSEQAASVPSEPTAKDTPQIAQTDTTPNTAPQKFKLKIDGVEEEVDADTLVRERQKYLASEKRFQEASSMRKEVESLLQRAQQGDLGWLKGLVPQQLINKWAESELLEHLEWEKKPDLEKRAILAEQKARQLEDRMTASEREKLERDKSSLAEKAHQEIENDVVTAIKELGYDKNVTPRLIRRIAEQMLASIEVSDDPQAKPMAAKLATDRAYKSMRVDAQELLSILPEQEIFEMLPPKIMDALRKRLTEEAISQVPFRNQKKTEGEEPVRKTKAKRMATEEWFSRMEKRFA